MKDISHKKTEPFLFLPPFFLTIPTRILPSFFIFSALVKIACQSEKGMAGMSENGERRVCGAFFSGEKKFFFLRRKDSVFWKWQ